MTDSMKYLWLLFREDSSYIFMLMLIVGSAVIVSAFFQRAIKSWWGKTLSVILCMVSMITTATGVLDPESTYKQIINRKENIIYTLKNCRISAFEAQQAGFLAKAKDEWVHVQLHQQKGMISLSPPTICNSALRRGGNI
ncbi:hypothetical protein [Klebsiella pneumoniae]|uniref:hypothetical protein n=1 Tax=Klebsiella pneumoniae TaxID=573 RepID=UPI00265A08A7|nr:hypothetical protein [Klebsiella pneumoniae]WKF89310.1 hypothetical protein QY481_01860 [Klebsiella pneumoniae]